MGWQANSKLVEGFFDTESSEFFQLKRARIRKSQPRKARKAEVVAKIR
jgi:hypothetical protein